jgi:predicted Zn-dependent protease
MTNGKTIFATLFAILFLGCVTADLPPIDEQKNFEPLPDEKRIWTRALEEQAILDRSGHLVNAPELNAYVNRVAAKLVPEKIRCQGITVEVRILNNPLLNAFAYPNGVIYVHSGILVKMDNEAQLAALLGHEMAHTIHRHAVESYRNVQNTRAVLTAAQIAAAPFGAYGILAYSVGALGATAAVSGYSQGRESEADATGLELMVAAGYDPREALRLFEHLKKDLEEQQIEEPFFFGTHPRLQERIDSTRRLLKTMDPGLRGATGTDAFNKHISALLLVNAEADIAVGRFTSGRKCIEKYIALHPDRAEGHFSLGELYRQRGELNDADRALKAYSAAVRCDPGHPAAYKGIGLIHYKQGRRKKARQAFTTYLKLDPNAADAAYIKRYLRELDQS